ncbi:MAG: hypothetical protein JST04_02565 [Bdellovibrionales bacterium]|nr:hypothetical protein [Bdellovibrionales bacterium]
MRNRVLPVRLGLLFVVCALSASARAGDPVVVKIPCDSAPWLTCADLKSKVIDGVADPQFPGGIKAAIRQMMDDAYEMNVRLAPNLVGQQDCTTFDNLNKGPLCSPLKLPENGCVDEKTKAYKVKSPTSDQCPAISMVGAATRDHPLFSLGTTGTGSIETSNVAAGLVMAISNQGADITAEMAKNALTISPTSPCYSKATVLQQLITQQSDVQLIAQINACDPTDTTQNCSAKEYFKANLTTILSGYVQLARCRLSDESTHKFIDFTKEGTKSYTEALKDLFIQQCFYPRRGDPAGMRACYAQRYATWIRDRSRKAFPNVASACSN